MLSPALHRLLWKETRTLGAVGLALVGISAMVQVGLVILTPPLQVRWDAFVSLGCGLFILFAAVMAAQLFAGEAEDGTDDLLRVLPIGQVQLATGKLGFAILAMVGFLIFAVGLALSLGTLAGFLPGGFQPRWRPVGGVVLFGVLAFQFAILGSVLSRRSLLLVVAVLCSPLVIVPVLMGLANFVESWGVSIPYNEAIFYSSLIAVLTAADFWAVSHWGVRQPLPPILKQFHSKRAG